MSELWNDNKIFIIAEIGCNHNGDLDLCKKMIRKANECGADAVKLQKRYNEKTFTKAILDAPYDSEYAKKTGTYGEHRAYLDRFDKAEFTELKKLADDIGIILFATPFDFKSVDFLASVDMPIYKIASCDFKNIPLIKYVAQLKKPMLISTGGADYRTMDFVYSYLDRLGIVDFAFLYCVSKYPNDDNLNLNCITKMKEMFPIPIGFSSHHPGIWPLSSAYHAGARIFEVHFTLNRAWASMNKDHAFSLEPQALRKACFDLKRIPTLMGNGDNRIVSEEEKTGFVWKFGKAIHLTKYVRKGEIVSSDNVSIQAPADGLEPYFFNDILGKTFSVDCSIADILTWDKLS
jgi:N-acetylneuraminate synthase/sialic acid synthase